MIPTIETSPPEFSQRFPAAEAPESRLNESSSQPGDGLPGETATPTSPLSNGVAEQTSELLAFSGAATPRPVSGPQLYQQRLAALKAGQSYTRLSPDSFWPSWINATEQPTYEAWKSLLAQEAKAISRGQGSNRLSILVGDSLSLWFPSGGLPGGRLWLNQGISGDTTRGILGRLSAFAEIQADQIYVMAGINDLRRGESDNEILWNLRRIMQELRWSHPDAEVVIQSILPNRLSTIPNHRIRYLNQRLAAIAQTEGVQFLDITPYFSDEAGNLRSELTTDGLHLNPRGYAVWQAVLQQAESWIAMNPMTAETKTEW